MQHRITVNDDGQDLSFKGHLQLHDRHLEQLGTRRDWLASFAILRGVSCSVCARVPPVLIVFLRSPLRINEVLRILAGWAQQVKTFEARSLIDSVLAVS